MIGYTSMYYTCTCTCTCLHVNFVHNEKWFYALFLMYSFSLYSISHLFLSFLSLSIQDHLPLHISYTHPLPLIHTLNTGHWQTGPLTGTVVVMAYSSSKIISSLLLTIPAPPYSVSLLLVLY